jgi:hypothetical protein
MKKRGMNLSKEISEFKEYTSVIRLGHKDTLDYLEALKSKNFDIQISIKLDGSNAQFYAHNSKLYIASRRIPLNENENLNGFYQYVLDRVDPKRLPEGIKIFGEWLVPRTVQYPLEMYKHFYIFDMFNVEDGKYIHPKSSMYKETIKYLVEEVGMKESFVIYDGPFKGMEYLEELLNKYTRTGSKYSRRPEEFDDIFHEGIVIKSYDYNTVYGKQLFVKLVSERFKEIKRERVKNEKGPDTSIELQIAEFAVTRARVEKMLHKLVDEGVLEGNFKIQSMRMIATILPKRIYEDIMKEELDTIHDEFGEFDEAVMAKKINKLSLEIAKEMIGER